MRTIFPGVSPTVRTATLRNWRLLVLAALGGLCLEIYLTRKLVRSQGTGVA